jgi:hypothetical protein
MLPTHAWPVHTALPTVQFEQNSPFFPQAAFIMPSSQRPVCRSMHPLQGSQMPATQDFPGMQPAQAAPPMPQRAVLGGF